MPELPEVETIARTLAPSVAGKSIVSLEVLNPKTWQSELGPAEFMSHGPIGIRGTSRRGKLLLLDLVPQDLPEPAIYLAFHLKMTGRVFAHEPGMEVNSHTRAVFGLSDGHPLFFDDCRKFGYIKPLRQKDLQTWPFWLNLGPEPLEVGQEEFAARFAGRSAPIKNLLLDQAVIAGVGNIYADESLFRAGIHPAAPGKSLSAARLEQLRQALVEVLEESIAACGSSIKDYRTANGDAGSFQNKFKAYGRYGEPCLNCGQIMEKTKIAGRTTSFCPKCQKIS